ncbi:MAG TPA: NYN domain-containing protein, partial [Ktedonobacteraceae bacterium]
VQDVQATPSNTEPAPSVIEEQPRPARRYRFDRPAATTNAPTGTAATVPPSVQVRPEEKKETPERGTATARTENGHTANGQNGEKEMPPLAQLPESAAPKQLPEVQEAPTAQSATTPTVAAVPEHDRRRRHGQERQRTKAQAAAPTAPPPTVSVTEIATEVVEAPVPSQAEEHPEDLPPLEYAELQKANSRRRRRRNSSSTAKPVSTASAVPVPATVKPVTAETPTAPSPAPIPPVTMPPTPRTPTFTPAALAPSNTPSAPGVPGVPANQYAVTSGYTVNQMNQSRDGSNPFMGPEPSPARGSIAAQNVRSIRTDVQRTPAYPVRTTEANAASIHQLANVVGQAIQTQTDRMIAELRRANQSPTNVSVTLPPFPSTERVGVFVDVANLLYSARTLRMAVDFGKLLDFLRGNRRLVRAQAYCPTSPQAGDEQMFLQAVKGLGYRITTKNYKTFSSGAKKADLDLDLCMDVVRLVDGRAVDCIVLVSGDSDFMPMLDYCSDHGVRVEVAAFDEAMSATLRQGCDMFINLS